MSEFKAGDYVVYKDSNKYKNHLFKVFDVEDGVAIAIEAGQECFVYLPDMRLAKEQEIAAGRRIDKTPLQKHLDECAEVVKTWPNWKVESVRKAFGIPDLGDDSRIENHISPLCKTIGE